MQNFRAACCPNALGTEKIFVRDRDAEERRSRPRCAGLVGRAGLC